MKMEINGLSAFETGLEMMKDIDDVMELTNDETIHDKLDKLTLNIICFKKRIDEYRNHIRTCEDTINYLIMENRRLETEIEKLKEDK